MNSHLDAIFRNLPTLETDRLLLRQLRASDARAMFDYASDPEVTRYLLWEPHATLEDSQAFIEYTLEHYRNGVPSSWGIILKESDILVGTIGFDNLSNRHNSCEVGYALARSQWNQGIATEALKGVIAFGFATLMLHRIEARCDTANIASTRVLEKSDMKFEGILRGEVFSNGEYRDMRRHGIIITNY